jgi:hypothetical protein
MQTYKQLSQNAEIYCIGLEIFMKSKHVLTGILLVLGILFCSCKNIKGNSGNIADLFITARGTPNGIYLNIDNIPEDATHLSISLYDITANDRLYTGANFDGNNLKQIKNAGFIVCPFVRSGHEYQITVDSFILTNL